MTLAELVDSFKATTIRVAFEANQYHTEKTAAELGISRKSLWELRTKYGIKKPDAVAP